ncbi:GNAT family N-acetyltransferase [Streptomyces sp. SID4919]|uniref:GNAT family N-acetyltransferase n=1 Tax=unclassified Streptomyces TaxID=2593676 RepID=UPI000823D53C|nr:MULTISPECIES: GNAT family N-acetyltransferase [unclassified Streptomyces]MYY09363.1 GNAT family N-acetyltransferase [Streptomyces sp. SID4919]SCK43087.1 Predicted acetyltransferase [Streptomyces sp. AmelKG-E11A]
MSWDEERLLALEIDANHGLAPDADTPCRTTLRDPSVLAVWAWSPHARHLALAPGLTLPSSVDGLEEKYSPGRLPEALRRLVASLHDRTVHVEGGPCFVFPDRLAVPDPTPLPLIASTTDGRRTAGHLIRPDNWQPDEWNELVNGRMGEWAMAVHDREPVSICFTPASNATAAEAGVWTRPDFRGKRLAPAVVAAWSQREHRTRTVLFYSTTADNHASRSVARALGLTPLGWIWTAR